MRYGPMLLPTSWIGVVAMCVSERSYDHIRAAGHRASERRVQEAHTPHPLPMPRVTAAAWCNEPSGHLAPTDQRSHGALLGVHSLDPAANRPTSPHAT